MHLVGPITCVPLSFTTSEDGIDARLLFRTYNNEIYRPVAKSTEDLRGSVGFYERIRWDVQFRSLPLRTGGILAVS